MDAQHGGKRIRRPAGLFAGFGTVRLDQFDQRLPRHHHLHLREKLLPIGLLFGRGELGIREAKLFDANPPRPGLGSQEHSPMTGPGFPESPWIFIDEGKNLN